MGEPYRVYGFQPQKGVPIAFAIWFAITTVVHIYQNFKFKSWRVTASLPWGGLLFVTGFVVREVSVRNDHDLGLLIASTVLFQFAPPVYSLTNYIVLGRTFYYVPYFSPIHPGRVITTFIGLDAIIGVITGNGASKLVNTSDPSQLKVGADLIRASILMQLITLLAFLTLLVIFHRRCLRAQVMNAKLRTMTTLLYASCVFLGMRHVYRVVEVWQGYDGYLSKHEAFFYIFDGALMLINSAMFNVWHPMAYLPHSWKIYLSPDGLTELEGDCVMDKRPFFVTLLDPFDLVGLIRGRDRDTFRDDLMMQARAHARGETTAPPAFTPATKQSNSSPL